MVVRLGRVVERRTALGAEVFTVVELAHQSANMHAMAPAGMTDHPVLVCVGGVLFAVPGIGLMLELVRHAPELTRYPNAHINGERDTDQSDAKNLSVNS